MDSSKKSVCSDHLLSVCSTIPNIVPFNTNSHFRYEHDSVTSQSTNAYKNKYDSNSNKNILSQKYSAVSNPIFINNNNNNNNNNNSNSNTATTRHSTAANYLIPETSLTSMNYNAPFDLMSSVSTNLLLRYHNHNKDCNKNDQFSSSSPLPYINNSNNLLSIQSTLPIVYNIPYHPLSNSINASSSLQSCQKQCNDPILITKRNSIASSSNNLNTISSSSTIPDLINNNNNNNEVTTSLNNIQSNHSKSIKRRINSIDNKKSNVLKKGKYIRKLRNSLASSSPSSSNQLILPQQKLVNSFQIEQSQSTNNSNSIKYDNIKNNNKITSSQLNITKDAITLIAIAEGCGVATEIGICVIHLPSNECQLYQTSDLPTFTKTLHKIHLANPNKILFSASALSSTSKLIELVEQHFSHITVISLPRKYFNEEDGLQYINHYGIEENITVLLPVIRSKYYCLTSVSSLFKYLEDSNSWTYLQHTIKFTYQSVEGTMMIDAITAKNLELVASLDTATIRSKDTLFGTMNHTSTAMGARLLRSTILQPCTDLPTIHSRLDAVEELLKYETYFFTLKSHLKKLSDMDHIITSITKIHSCKKRINTNITDNNDANSHQSIEEEEVKDDGKMKMNIQHQSSSLSPYLTETKINKIILLKNTLITLRQISQILLNVYSENTLLKKVGQILSNEKLDQFREIIDNTLNENIGYEKTSLGLRNQRCYAIKSGINGLLDVARQTYTETIQNIYEMITCYCEETKLNIKLQFDTERKFHLMLSEDQYMDAQSFPSTFINITKKKKSIFFSTLELLQKNSRVDESLAEIYMMSDRTVNEILQSFRSDIDILYKSSESIAVLDLLVSFATSCMKSKKVRPEFTDTLAIKSGRHPILETTLISKDDLVCNDTYASISSSFQIITGPNMSGKSTYIKQIALLTIMAHTGSFVPAEYASFSLCPQILSRLTNDIDFKISSFMAEMQEMNYILQHVTNSSLVIIDELGRGTCQADAIGIATAICEHIIRTRANCFFVTHMIELAKWLEVYPNVINLQLSTQMVNIQDDTYIYTYIHIYIYIIIIIIT
ncbi:unnamed protein product [Cunninghamella echinulata]